MKQTEELLTQMGLTSTEARIYLAGLTEESVTIQDLGAKTKIKRPTIYHAVNTLIEKGLVEEKKKLNKSRLSMAAPESIRALVEREREQLDAKSKSLDDLIPLLLQQRTPESKDSTSVVHYTGIEGMKMVLDLAFYCKSKHWEVIAPIHNFLREYDKEYATRYLNARSYYGITARTLWEPLPESRKLTDKEIDARNPRFMPVQMRDKFKSMMILFDDKVAIFSSYEKMSAVLITSKEIHEMFLALFDGVWEVSEPYT